jgi:hypothetical protein
MSQIGEDAQDCILGYSQPSLRDWSVVSNPTQDSRPGLLSAVPTGLNSEPAVLTYGLKPVPFKNLKPVPFKNQRSAGPNLLPGSIVANGR